MKIISMATLVMVKKFWVFPLSLVPFMFTSSNSNAMAKALNLTEGDTFITRSTRGLKCSANPRA